MVVYGDSSEQGQYSLSCSFYKSELLQDGTVRFFPFLQREWKISLALTSKRQFKDTRKESPSVDQQGVGDFSQWSKVFLICALGGPCKRIFTSPHLSFLLYFSFLYVKQFQRDLISASPAPSGPLQRFMQNRYCRAKRQPAPAHWLAVEVCEYSCLAPVKGSVIESSTL